MKLLLISILYLHQFLDFLIKIWKNLQKIKILKNGNSENGMPFGIIELKLSTISLINYQTAPNNPNLAQLIKKTEIEIQDKIDTSHIGPLLMPCGNWTSLA